MFWEALFQNNGRETDRQPEAPLDYTVHFLVVSIFMSSRPKSLILYCLPQRRITRISSTSYTDHTQLSFYQLFNSGLGTHHSNWSMYTLALEGQPHGDTWAAIQNLPKRLFAEYYRLRTQKPKYTATHYLETSPCLYIPDVGATRLQKPDPGEGRLRRMHSADIIATALTSRQRVQSVYVGHLTLG